MIRRQAKNNAQGLIQLITMAMRDGSGEKLRGYLKILPLEMFKAHQADSYFNRFLTIAITYQQKEVVKILFKTWERVYPIQNKVPHFSNLFFQHIIGVDVLKFCSQVFPGYSYLSVMNDIVQFDVSPEAELASQRAIDVYGEQSLKIYEDLFKLASNNANSRVMNFMVNKIRKISEYAPIPKWVKNFEKGDRLPYESEITIPEYPEPKIKVPSIDKMVKLLTEGLKNQGISIEQEDQIKNELGKRLAIATYMEKIILLQPVIDLNSKEDLQNDIELFRKLGPANPLIGASLEEMKYGGARMFISTLFDGDFDDDDIDGLYDNEDWFEGFCWQCDKRILRRWHAIRMPLAHGGWKGVFCSVKCVRYSIAEYNGPDIFSQRLVSAFEEQLKAIGIQDRLPDEEKKLEEKMEKISLSNIVEIPPSSPIIPKISVEEEKHRIIKITSIDDYNVKINSGNLILMIFTANYCQLCRRMLPFLKNLSQEYQDEDFYVIDTTELPDITFKENVKGIPTIIFYQNKKKIDEVSGDNSTIRLKITKIINDQFRQTINIKTPLTPEKVMT